MNASIIVRSYSFEIRIVLQMNQFPSEHIYTILKVYILVGVGQWNHIFVPHAMKIQRI